MLTGNKKYANEILDDVECYKAVLDGRLKRFPQNFWSKPYSIQSSAVITRYLLEERLKYTEEDIKANVDAKLFKTNRLTSLLRVFNSSPYGAINNAYPNRFKPWELKSVSLGFWSSTDNIKEVVIWLVETKLGNSRERVCREFTIDFLNKYKMYAIIPYGVYNLIELAYPNQFKPWELTQVASGFWSNTNNIKDAIRWVIETKLDNDRERVCREFSTELLTKYKLHNLATLGVYRSLNIAYPNEFKQWELNTLPQGFWNNEDNIREVVRWIVETKLGNNRDRICNEWSSKLLRSCRVGSIANYGVYNVLNIAYPNEFKPSELRYDASKGD